MAPPGVATPGVSSFWGAIVNRTVFLVEGFNLYHSLREVERGPRHSLRWLDLDALQATGVETILSQFKRRQVRCPFCGRVRDRWEEKQTDVGIAVRLMKLAAEGTCDRVVVVSGDTDLVPAISEAQSTWTASIGVAFPARRANAQPVPLRTGPSTSTPVHTRGISSRPSSPARTGR